MRLKYDLHTHTTFSHGKGSIEDNVKVAIAQGLSAIGISDHGPGHYLFGIKRNRIAQMRDEIERLKPLYPEIKILLGVEANIINLSGSLDITEDEIKLFDYIMAGYHFATIGENPIKATRTHISNKILKTAKTKNINTELIINALWTNEELEVVTHPGSKGEIHVLEVAKVCEETDTLMEINNRHGCLSVEAIKEASKTDVKFILGSDAHRPEHVGLYEDGLKRAIEAGIDLERIVNLERE